MSLEVNKLGHVASAIRTTLRDNIVMAFGDLRLNDRQDLENTIEQASALLHDKLRITIHVTPDTLKYIRSHSDFDSLFVGSKGLELAGLLGWFMDQPVITDAAVPVLDRKWKPLPEMRLTLLKATEEHYAILCSNRPRRVLSKSRA